MLQESAMHGNAEITRLLMDWNRAPPDRKAPRIDSKLWLLAMDDAISHGHYDVAQIAFHARFGNMCPLWYFDSIPQLCDDAMIGQ
jgi:hypothetical protein